MSTSMVLSARKTEEYKSVEKLYNKLLENAATDVKKSNLKNVWEVLNELKTSGAMSASKYGWTAISKLTVLKGGPAYSSIANGKQGKDFRDLITAFRDAIIPINGEIIVSSSVEKYFTYLDEIQSEHARHRIKDMLLELRSMKKQLDIAKSDIRTGAEPIITVEKKESIQIENKPILNQLEYDAIGEFLNTIEQKGYKLNKNGSIEDPISGVELSPPGFTIALNKIILGE